MTDKAHGVYGFAQYCKDGPDGKHCDVCKVAINEYMREYRHKNQKQYNEQKSRQQLRNKALRILAQRHPQELQKIIFELKEKS